MLLFLTKFFYNISCTLCFIGIFFKFFKCLTVCTMNEMVSQFGKTDLLGFFVFIYSLTIFSYLKSSIFESFSFEEFEYGECMNWILENFSRIIKGRILLSNILNTMGEYFVVVIFCRRQFTFHSSFFFWLLIFIKNMHLPWITTFRKAETLNDETPVEIEIASVLSIFFFVQLESNLARYHLNYSKRRLANCIVGSELLSLALILKGLAINKCFLLLTSHLNWFKYGQLHCFYLRIITFLCLSVFQLISLINIGLTKKVIFKFYVATRVFSYTKETIENFLELNRFRKMTKSLNHSMSSPTKEDIDNLSDQLCIICRDELTQNTSKKLSCGHIFHIACLQNWMIRQYCCPTCLTPISSKSKNPLNEVEREVYQPNRAKIDFLSLVLGCKDNLDNKYYEQNLKIKHSCLPSLDPDLTSIIFSKNFSSEQKLNKITYGDFQYLHVFEKLCKIKTFILENLFYFSRFDLEKNFTEKHKKNKLIMWNENKLIETANDLKKITKLIPEIIE